jgi:uncharacterized membrane protein
MDHYALLKLVHILSATLLFGTGLGSAFYLWRAHGNGDVAVIAGVSRQVVLADWLFTLPAVILQPLTGIWMAQIAGYAMSELWILLAFALYGLAGGCWLPVVWLQLRIRDMATAAHAGAAPLPARYYHYMRIWFVLGWPAFLAMVAAFAVMIYKPAW